MVKSKVTVFQESAVCIHGKEFRMIRRQRKLSLAALVERMNKRGWAYYPTKLHRLEQRVKFCLPGNEMVDLLDALGVDFNVHKS